MASNKSYFAVFDNALSIDERERRVLQLWQQHRVFERSLQQRSSDARNCYAFYDGPPFATGLPHYGHFVASSIKDTVLRYFSMQGRYVQRRFGWDTHGLPIEMQIEKELGISGPGAIREYGVARFNEACRSSVLRYTKQWRQTIERLGRFVDFDNDYKTMDPCFMESVWWVFAQLWHKGLVEKGFRVMPYSWRLATPLSNFEAGLDYQSVQDPAITLRLPLQQNSADKLANSLQQLGAIPHNTPLYLLVWTTTPWTLPANLAVAVHPDMQYAVVRDARDNAVYIVAKSRLDSCFAKSAPTLLANCLGRDLVGLQYEPPFSYFTNNSNTQQQRFRVLPSDHVSNDAGTGVVHLAPAYGQEDHQVCQQAGIELVDPVDSEGNFTQQVPEFAGQNIKQADAGIIRTLKQTGKLFQQDTIQHSYPYCWRSHTPLIYKAVPVWLVKVTQLRDRMCEHNNNIRWVPDAVGHKRFANWLSDAQDWTVSRNRFWGTPIPIWSCTQCDKQLCIDSIQQLQQLCGQTVDDLHSHHIDKLTVTCPNCQGHMQRTPEVFDCWFESGCMPYAQQHYPFEHKQQFANHFPAQFISEGLDQTRGWFYTLLVLSTALFDKPPFHNVIVNGLVLAQDGSKMSKSKRNYPDPHAVLTNYGADALRAYLVSSPVARAEPLQFNEQGVREMVRTVILPLHNACSFFVQYAHLDSWHPASPNTTTIPLSQRPVLDQWITSRLHSLINQVNTHMHAYRIDKVVPALLGFVDELTNWYIRQSRRRFWRQAHNSQQQQDKQAAYHTLHEVLVTLSKCLAPLLPFVSETLYQHVAVAATAQPNTFHSVHLCDYPKAQPTHINPPLEQHMALTRQAVSMGRALREQHKLKVRQPLSCMHIACSDSQARQALAQHTALIQQELNVKQLQLHNNDEELCSVQIKANFKTLGKRLGKQMKQAAYIISQWGTHELNTLRAGNSIPVCNVAINQEDIVVEHHANPHQAVCAQGQLSVALNTQLTNTLRTEGLARETISQLQKLRKQQGLTVADQVHLQLHTPSTPLQQALQQHATTIAQEVLATQLDIQQHPTTQTDATQPTSPHPHTVQVDDYPLHVQLNKPTHCHTD